MTRSRPECTSIIPFPAQGSPVTDLVAGKLVSDGLGGWTVAAAEGGIAVVTDDARLLRAVFASLDTTLFDLTIVGPFGARHLGPLKPALVRASGLTGMLRRPGGNQRRATPRGLPPIRLSDLFVVGVLWVPAGWSPESEDGEPPPALQGRRIPARFTPDALEGIPA